MLLTEQKQYIRLFQVLSDLLSLIIVYYVLFPPVLYVFSFSGPFNRPLGSGSHTIFLFLEFSFLYIVVPPLLMAILGRYRTPPPNSAVRGCVNSLLLSMAGSGILAIILSRLDFVQEEIIFFSLVSSGFLLPVTLLNRFNIAWMLKTGQTHPFLIKHILLTDTGEKAQTFAAYVNTHPETGLRITGYLTEKPNEIDKSLAGSNVVGDAGSLFKVVHDYYADCVVALSPGSDPEHVQTIAKNCSVIGLDFAASDDIVQADALPHERIFLEDVGDTRLTLVKFVYQNVTFCFVKRVFDFCVASAMILACIPLWIVISYAIKTTSPGPVLYRQKRLGKYGRRFTLYKFRSMFRGAEKMQEGLQHLNEMDGPAFKIKEDPRLTRIGIFLRKTSLDELPQLFNVFKGDISLVGPRPAIEDEVAQYRPMERKRLAVTQGLTCIWQISGRNDIKFDEWMKLDQLYIEYWSPAQDLKILFRTVPAVLLKKGAY